MSRNAFAVTSWTDANMKNCQTHWDSVGAGPGAPLKQETDFTPTGLRDVSALDYMFAPKRHHENAIQENGYGSPPDKERSTMNNRDARHCQYEHGIHRERPKNFEMPVTVDSLADARAENDGRHQETWKIKDLSPMGAKDSSKTRNSEVTKIVPLKPQRSKKSLNKENKGDVNPQNQTQPERVACGASGDVHMAKSKNGSWEAGRRPDDSTILQSATDAVKENIAATKHHSEAAMSYRQQTQQIKNEWSGQQELRDWRDATGQSQWTRGGGVQHEDFSQNSSENLFSSYRYQTAPPRTLPLKTQWTRERQSNVDSSHIHYRTSSQETAKRKQAVKKKKKILPP